SAISVPEDRDLILRLGTDPDSGAMYGFPCYQHSSGPDNATEHVLINTAWLDAVGEDVPETPDELYTVLKKFASEDPNGNGLADELPMVGASRIPRGDTLQWVINAYIYCNDQYFWNVDDGRVSVPYTEDEYREALIFLNRLYDEDLLSPKVFTVSANEEMKEILTPSDGTAVAGVTGGHISLIHNEGNDLLFDYRYFPALDAGTGRGGYRMQSGSAFRYSTFITKDCEDPALAFRLLDFLCSEEAFLFMRYGVEGRDWEYAKNGMLDMYGEQAKINVIDASVFSSRNNVCWHALDSTIADYSSHMMYSPTGDSGSYTERFNAWKDQFTMDFFRDRTKDELVFQILWPGSIASEIARRTEKIRSYVLEQREMFISGVKDPRDELAWHEYLDELEDMGLTRCIALAQEYYDKMRA
ncbi:MAG: extracellular solute-binding protein, partial [Oscillibacter sp.]|nr:extracellular solute-binding protein [Oscillibacter sp.]